MDLNIKKVDFGEAVVDAEYSGWGYFNHENLSKKNEIFLSSGVLPKVVETLYLCPHCLKYSPVSKDMTSHREICRYRSSPPGRLVYDAGDGVSIYRVDGMNSADKLFSQCLCLCGKLFLESKSIFYATSGFDLFVLVHKVKGIMGFFSREKVSWEGYNLACITVFPQYRGNGYGQLLIAYSYHLSRLRKVPGSPEKPLSKDGQRTYSLYWKVAVYSALLALAEKRKKTTSITSLSNDTGIIEDDVATGLELLGCDLKTLDMESLQKDEKLQQLVMRQPKIDKRFCYE